ncbi:MAG: glutaminyl-peptide cyclotransferase [Acidimicrobiales bacterium]
MRRITVLANLAVLATASLAITGCGSLDSAISSQALPPVATTAPNDGTTPTTDAGSSSTTAPTGDTTPTSDTTEPATGAETTLAPLPSLAGPLNATVVATYPHDPTAYTEGLEFYDGSLVEATGLYGASSRRIIDIASGSINIQEALQPEHWGSGLSFTADTGIQVTRNESVAILFDPIDLKEIGRFDYPAQGWGVCATDEIFYVGVGANTVSLRDPMSFLETGTMTVTQDGTPLTQLGEMECVGDQLWAVVWPSNTLVQFNRQGQVTATADLTALVPEGLAPEDTLSGIAYNERTGTFFITGKRWPSLFEISFAAAG